MDRKNTILGMICIGAGIAVMFWQAKQVQEQQEQAPPAAVEESSPPAASDAADSPAATESGPTSTAEPEATGESVDMLDLLAKEVPEEEVEPAAPEEPAERIRLANEFIEVTFTTRGGAIDQVAFLRTKRGGRDTYVYNENGMLPALSMSLAGAQGVREFNLNFEVESRDAHSITFALDVGKGLTLRRSYSLANGEGTDPYVIDHRISFENGSDSPRNVETIYLNLGTARPIAANQLPNYLNVGTYDGEDSNFTAVNKLTGSGGFLGIGSSSPRDEIIKDGRFEWVSVKNQFFAGVLSASQAANEVRINPVYPDNLEADGVSRETGITANAAYGFETLAPRSERELDFKFYIGPKEFKRLQALGNEQDRVMQFGWFGFFSKLLLAFMYAIHAVVPSWGWSIVIMTIIIKTLFWPLTANASRSQKRMQKIQEPMKELREKYKDNPQKMQQETMKLFKEHRVNPVAGCLPILIQMPIFLGLFYMLRTASELRHEPFLWVQDLSQPDTIAEIGGFPLNLLPLIMGATMYFQMQMMPVSPTADPMQQKIFKFLPFIFLIFLYNFSSGLVVYWTVQNLLTIVQQKIINSRPDEPLEAKAGNAADAAKPVSGKVVSGRAKGKRKKK